MKKNKEQKIRELAEEIMRLDWIYGTTWAQAVEEARQVVENKVKYYDID